MAATKISALTALATLTADDLFVVVDNPGGTPTSRKITAATLLAYVQSEAFAKSWASLPASSLDLITTADISGTAGFTEHGQFRMWHELHTNAPGGTGYDYSFAFGFNGNGTTTNVALWTQEVSYDPIGTYKTNEHYMTYQHVDATYWPTPRRNCWGVSTFSNNRGNIANPMTIGFANLDQIQFTGLQPSVGGSKAGWRYCQMSPQYNTGAFVFELASEASNYGQALFSLSSSGLALNITGNTTIASSGASFAINWSGGALAINGTNRTVALTTSTLNVTNLADNGASPAGQFFNSNPNNFNFNTVELRTQSANQIASLGLWNQNNPKWAIKNRGDSSDRFTIFNDVTDTDAVSISNSTNDVTLIGKLNLPASTTTKAPLNVPSGTAPTTPVNGDIWSDGTDLKWRIGGVTKTITTV